MDMVLNMVLNMVLISYMYYFIRTHYINVQECTDLEMDECGHEIVVYIVNVVHRTHDTINRWSLDWERVE